MVLQIYVGLELILKFLRSNSERVTGRKVFDSTVLTILEG